MSPTRTRAELLDVALATAARGWPVFPLLPATKRPALHGATRCPGVGACAGGHQGWEHRATTDPDRIRTAWTAGPAFNIGLATGPAGLVVVDLDTPDPADCPPEPWARLGVCCGADVLAVLAERARQPIPATYTVITPSGGAHLYYLAPPEARLRNTVGLLGWKIDTRGRGGYVVAAGSTTPAGAYTPTDDRDPVPLPAWLARRLQPPPPRPVPVAPVRLGTGRPARYLEAALKAETARVIGAAAGQRNHSLYIAAVALGQLVAGGALAEADARAVLLAAANLHLAVGAYTLRQAEQTITSGLRAGAKRPRQLGDAA